MELETSSLPTTSPSSSGTCSLSHNEIEAWIQIALQCKYLPEPEMKKLCERIKEILLEESNVHCVSTPVTVCGDIHGQFYDLKELFRIGGQIPQTNYVFMGDYVDRGYYSLETFTLLLALKARYPDRITLLRGNHESREITQVYGFFDECQQKYGNPNVWKYCTEVFDLLTLAALIDGRVLCVHAGISPDLKTLDDICLINRNQEIPHEGGFCDLMWSDPDNSLEGWRISPRGAGWLFGAHVVTEFMAKNNLDLLCRAHQLVQDGYEYMFDKKLVTVWSAPNYCYRCGNVASILALDSNLNQSFTIFQAVPDDQRTVPDRRPVPYFL